MKKRYWAFILYLESAPNDWLQKLIETGIPFCISPYHDKDIDPTGIPKKPHFHIILAYNGPTTYKNVENLTKSLNQTIPKALESVLGYYRYLTHEDNPEKYQYSKKDIQAFNGFDIGEYDFLTKTQIKGIIIAIQQFIIDNSIFEYSDLMDELLHNELWEWHEVASTHTLFFSNYLNSRRYKAKQETFIPIPPLK